MAGTTPKQPQDHLRSRKKPMSKTLRFVGDPAAMDRLEEARQQLQSFESMAQARGVKVEGAELARLNEDLTAAQAEVDESTIKIRFEGLSRRRYDEIQKEHPPTEEQKKEGDEETGPVTFNPDTYPPALVLACMTEVWVGGKLVEFADQQEKREFINDDSWNTAEFMEMWMTAIQVNQTRRQFGDLGKDSMQIPYLGLS